MSLIVYSVFMKRLVFSLLLFSSVSLAETVGDFRLSVLSDEVPGARQMAETESGLLLVGSLRPGKLYAVLPGSEGKAEVVTFAEGLLCLAAWSLSARTCT